MPLRLGLFRFAQRVGALDYHMLLWSFQRVAVMAAKERDNITTMKVFFIAHMLPVNVIALMSRY